MAEPRFDIVVFGATGFTGELTAEYLAAHAPAGLRWALAGRNRDKLEAVRARLGEPARELELLSADIADAASMRAVAESTRVVITTVGPYINYGEPLVAACAAAGTDYVDLTGEPEFVDRMYLAYHEQAQRSGARIVHSCGFDSIPYDLGTLFTVQQLPEGVPIHVDCYVRAGGAMSGGTYQSALAAFARLRHGVAVGRERRRVQERPEGRRVRGSTRPLHKVESLGAWALPFPTIDPQTVLRSARARNWFKVRFEATAGDQQLTTQVSGGDPGYGETAKMLAESGLCLALDELPQRAGQITPAVAMGDALIERLIRAGITFEGLG